ncbi:complex I intermediate-associated protein 30, mitochondrial [Elysia marginata]|uniref:Complex I intermediate-associated protein 30, mitochondrial n=1 Tax=Elysia marginata TaxID=1093978 RepID=A0AAV4G574_9GAST|nr:complex I intermediate-associated protein 30, mitochondrial [Elysia marginata]
MASTSYCRLVASRSFDSLLKRSPKDFGSVVARRYEKSTAVFYEKNKKGLERDLKRRPLKQALKMTFQNLGPELKLFYQEQKQAYTGFPLLSVDHGNYEVIYTFNDPESVKSWAVTADRDNDGGKSTANFTFSKNRTGLFHGYLCKEVPKDGVTKYAGYANITSPKPMKSFGRESQMDWSLFNCLLLRLRGDGRPYMIVIGCNFHYDINWLNRWSYPVFTRGGPYWQHVKIPLSKFFTTHHGRIQDKQEFLPLKIINSLGITAADSAEGPFSLEIDSIALMNDVNLTDKHAYEMYENKYYEVQC